MRELYRCSMMPGMPAEPVSDSRLSAQDVMPVCGTCQSAGRMAAGDKELLMRQIMEAGFAMDDVVLFLDTHPSMAAYERRFGPLRYTDVTSMSWDWVTEKWPWEGGC